MLEMDPRYEQFVCRFEQCKLEAYLDKDGTWHLGFGHGNASGQPPFVDATTKLKDAREALDILYNDMRHEYVPLTQRMVKPAVWDKLTAMQKWQLVDLNYNRGFVKFRDSLVLKWVNADDVEHHLALAAAAFADHDPELDGKEYAGLNISMDPKNPGGFKRYLGLDKRRICNAYFFVEPLLPPVDPMMEPT
jgi:GH24 family phage-related lysozyme (muramidase)